MLQRTKADQVVPIYNEFVEKYPNFYKARDEDPQRIIELISKLGLNWRAEKVIELLEVLSERSGKIPQKKDELIRLPGVGEYIANAYLSFYRCVKAPITDSNAVRLWSRVFSFENAGEIRRRKWFNELCLQLTPDRDFRDFNYALLDFCRKICKTKPMCSECPLRGECDFFNKERDIYSTVKKQPVQRK